jgi:hypothetical protein
MVPNEIHRSRWKVSIEMNENPHRQTKEYYFIYYFDDNIPNVF